MGASPEQIQLISPASHTIAPEVAAYGIERMFAEFDVREASCYVKGDQTRLLAIVEAGFEGIHGARACSRAKARLRHVAR